MTSPVPPELRTARLLLRPWRVTDAPSLLPLLESNVAHLAPWIPAHVADPAPLPQLAERLAGYASDFESQRAYRYALLSRDDSRLLGEVDLFPRASSGRVPLADADRAELGYWLDASATGQGFVTEAVRALLDVAATLPQLMHAEIRCNAGNARSAAVPQRLGFHLAAMEQELEVWRKPFSHAAR